MPGLSLKVGGFGGVGTTASPPAYGTQSSYDSVTSAAFGPGVTVPQPSASATLKPDDGFGVAVWTGIAAVVLLVVIRQSLPR